MLVDGLRPLWLPAMSGVNGTPSGRISEWVGRGQYYFDSPVGPSSASFVLTPGAALLDVFAAEMSRFSGAAIETSLGITQPGMPKSTAWLFIQTYYAGFYAAHSLLRSVGISASNFRAGECQVAEAVAAALGFGNGPLNAAQFRCEYIAATGRLECSKAHGGGIHEQFWRVFDSFLQSAMNRILRNSSLAALDAQDIFSRLADLRTVLTSFGHAGGNWLSTIRNDVTYMQLHKAWFPYGRSRADCDRLFTLQKQWRRKPDDIRLRAPGSMDAELFVLTCAFLVSLSTAVVHDMALRCPSGESFLSRDPLKLLRQAQE